MIYASSRATACWNAMAPRYAYQLTTKDVQIALLFLFFHKRLFGPLANSRFHHQPDPAHRPNSKLEAAYHKADVAIQEHRRSAGRRVILSNQMLKYSCLRSSI